MPRTRNFGATVKLRFESCSDRRGPSREGAPFGSVMMPSGRTVAAGIETDGQRHVLIADLRPGPLRITRVRLFGPG